MENLWWFVHDIVIIVYYTITKYILLLLLNIIILFNPFALEAIYTRNFFFDRLSDSV